MRQSSTRLREVFSRSFARRWVPGMLALLLGALSLNPTLAGSFSTPVINPDGAAVSEEPYTSGPQEPTLAQKANVYRNAYKPFHGSFTVDEKTFNMRDASRNRLLPVKVYYPKVDADRRIRPFPVIVFSHGFGASKAFYQYLGHYYASHGYISIHPDHIGSNTAFIVNAGAQIQNGQTTLEAVSNSVFESETVARAEDISFLINNLGIVETKIPTLKGRIERNAIGLAGHSLGAGTTDLMSGMEGIPPSGKSIKRTEPRIKAFVSISGASLMPQTPGTFYENVSTFNQIQAPVMRFMGTQERTTPEESADYQRNHLAAFKLYPHSGNKYEIQVQGADHQDFAAVSTKPGGLFYATTMTRNLSLAFFDQHLKRDPKGAAFLQTRRQQFAQACNNSQTYTQ